MTDEEFLEGLFERKGLYVSELPFKPPSPAEKQNAIIEMVDDGKSVMQIAEHFKVGTKHLQKYCKRHKIKIKTKGQIIRERILSLKNHMTNREIADELQITESYVRASIWRHRNNQRLTGLATQSETV